MIHAAELFAIFAAACLIPSLYRGAVQDLEEYRFSEIHFNTLRVNVAALFAILSYLSFLIDGLWLIVVEYVILSVIATLIFMFIGFRFGGGGDWRALIYVSWIAPLILINVVIASLICALVQAIYWVLRSDIDTPWLYRKIPFAVSILAGYVIALIWMIVTIVRA